MCLGSLVSLNGGIESDGKKQQEPYEENRNTKDRSRHSTGVPQGCLKQHTFQDGAAVEA
ncbi:unnamed protein product [Camellia sinensis]